MVCRGFGFWEQAKHTQLGFCYSVKSYAVADSSVAPPTQRRRARAKPAASREQLLDWGGGLPCRLMVVPLFLRRRRRRLRVFSSRPKLRFQHGLSETCATRLELASCKTASIRPHLVFMRRTAPWSYRWNRANQWSRSIYCALVPTASTRVGGISANGSDTLVAAKTRPAKACAGEHSQQPLKAAR